MPRSTDATSRAQAMLLSQIEAIASRAVGPIEDGRAYRVGELLTIRMTIAEALAKVDTHLNWRLEEKRRNLGCEPDPRNGEYFAIGPCTEHDDSGAIKVDHAVVWYSSSGNCADVIDGFATMAEAEAAARLEALRRDCVLIPGRGA